MARVDVPTSDKFVGFVVPDLEAESVCGVDGEIEWLLDDMVVADFADIAVLIDDFEVVFVAFFERFDCDLGDAGSHLTIIFKFKLLAKYFNTFLDISCSAYLLK